MTRENKRFALENTVLDVKYQIKEPRSRMKTRGILLQAEKPSLESWAEAAEPEGSKMLNSPQTVGGIKDHFIPCLGLYWKQGCHFF